MATLCLYALHGFVRTQFYSLQRFSDTLAKWQGDLIGDHPFRFQKKAHRHLSQTERSIAQHHTTSLKF